MFSVDELTIVKIYYDLKPSPDKDDIIDAISEALPFMDDEIRPVAESALVKIAAMSEDDFYHIDFSQALF